MGVLLTTDYTNLTSHLLILDEIFNDAMRQAVDKQVWLQIFDTKQNNHRNDTVQLNHGLGTVKFIPENTDYPEASGKEGDKITFTKYKYGANVVITLENRIYDEYDQVETNVKSIVDVGYNLIDQSLGDILGHGFSNVAYVDVYGQLASAVWPDGLALFSAAHTNTSTLATYSNIMTSQWISNPSISRQAIIDTRVRGMRYKDPQGTIRPIYYDTILVAPEQEDYVTRLIGSEQVAGTANNDTNSYLKGKMKVQSWSKLSIRSDGVDTSNYWYMYDSSMIKNTLKAFFARYPELLPPAEYDPNKNWNYLFHFIYSRGFSRAPYLQWSNGSLLP